MIMRAIDMLRSHEQAPIGAQAKCAVCGRESRPGENFHNVTGLGRVCMTCGLESVTCESCGTKTKRVTITRTRGKLLCLRCYSRERETGEKRISRTFDEGEIDPSQALKLAVDRAPAGYTLVLLRLQPSSKRIWTADYERKDIFEMRCS